MRRNSIIFVGGIHGVGKSTLCKKACELIGIKYLSASSVLNWAKVNNNQKSKKVQDITQTQDLLINGLKKFITDEKVYLLDGHFCLLNKRSEICKIPVGTFELINPLCIVVLTETIDTIKSRLEDRDKISYDSSLLAKMQNDEIQYAKAIAKHLKIDYHEYKNAEFLQGLGELQQYIG